MATKPFSFRGKQFRIGLSHIAAHGLPHDHRLAQGFPGQRISSSHLALSIREKVSRKGQEAAWPGASHTSRLYFPSKQATLFVKQADGQRSAPAEKPG